MNTDKQPDFLLERDRTDDWPRWRQAAAGSAVFHFFAIIALFTIKGSPYLPPPPERIFVPRVITLVTPKELTQKAPNKAPVRNELMAPAIAPTPKVVSPAPSPPPRPAAPAPPQPSPAPAPVAPPPAQPAVSEAPKIPAPVAPPPAVAQAPPAVPRLTVEDAPRPQPRLAVPDASLEAAVRSVLRGTASNSQSVGESEDIGSGLNLPPSAAQPRSGMELKSDPMGVDFRPYMLQVLAAIRRNWFAVYPEAARLGLRGQVALQFSIAKQGDVAKVVFSTQSGSRPLDQAAVAAVSASNPLPPLPPDFRGDRIVLQMNFLYNMPR